ncbi:MAG: hypothetical protein HY702_01180 [Gemmatimonadetes bacterium]|nr:hypothetical protein [Gemmatimonadota bacterium]
MSGPVGDEVLQMLRERHPRFAEEAYLFVLSALQRILNDLGEPRHISGRELAMGVRDLALEKFGPMARTVLGHWGIHSTEDVGAIVFALVDCGILIKQPTDSPEAFRDVFDFEEVFERNYPWAGRRFP